jgi:photosystem II stability/assembly factor-like uncharacterized protein
MRVEWLMTCLSARKGSLRKSVLTLLVSLPLPCAAGFIAHGQDLKPVPFDGLQWRLIGPFRGGRATAVTGVPSQPAVYYMGTPGGGVWKTTNAGRTWYPIFDQQHIASIGSLAVSPSSPNIIYVGTGEQMPGSGLFKSTDAGKTWSKAGLEDTRYIGAIVVDPRNPEIVIAAASYNPQVALDAAVVHGEARGIFKSTDGGRSWKNVLGREALIQMVDLCPDPDDPTRIYAGLTVGGTPRGAPGSGPDGTIYRSTDEGSSWQPVTGSGLRLAKSGHVGIAVAPGTKGRRLYAKMGEGLFISEDGGANWRRSTTDPRIAGSSLLSFYFDRVFVNPTNAAVVYVVQAALLRSTDGGKTFTSITGNPNGEDYHVVWINPTDSHNMIVASDQGARVSIDGGETWSSFYNQPTGQFYSISTDNQFPYHVYGDQQDSSAVEIVTRSRDGEISFRDWASVRGWEAGYIAADPLNPNFVYSANAYGTVIRFDRTAGQWVTMFVPGNQYRRAWNSPMMFSPIDPHTLYIGTQCLMRTTDGGVNWESMSPDLTGMLPREQNQNADGAAASAAITTIAPSPIKAGVIWIGTTNGRIRLTTDGGSTWADATPPVLVSQPGVTPILEASRFEEGEAYAPVTITADPHSRLYRTTDFGKTWHAISEGLPGSEIVRVVREDPVRKGLLYAGTDTGVFISFDDGAHWQSLQLNLPTASVRDLNVHGNDLVAGTFGRSLWILDDVSPLRQLNNKIPQESAHLFVPETALRVRWDLNADVAFPIETPAGQNPPDGAIFYYYLNSLPAGEIKLAIKDERGRLVREFSSVPEARTSLSSLAPDYWFAPPEKLSNRPGINRFVWDLRYPAPLALSYGAFGDPLEYIDYTLDGHIAPGQTSREITLGPMAAPGKFTAILTVGDESYSREFTVKLDPRIKCAQEDLVQQMDLALQLTDEMAVSYEANHQVRSVRKALLERMESLQRDPQASADLKTVATFERKLGGLEGQTDPLGFGPVNMQLTRVLTMVDRGDIAPARTAREAARDACQSLNKALAAWRQVSGDEMRSINELLQRHHLQSLPSSGSIAADQACTR